MLGFFANKKWLAIAAGALLVIVFVWWLRHDAYKDGVRATDAKWVEAGRRLEEAAAKSATKADVSAEARAMEFNDKVLEEKEKLDEAERSGDSPLDVLFGGNRM